MTALPGSQDLSRSAQLQVAHGDRVSRSQLAGLANRLQPLPCIGGEAAGAIEKVGVRPPSTPPHPAPQLVQLRQAEPLRLFHD